MKTESKAYPIASMSCGVASLLLVIAPYFGLPLAILGVVLYYKNKNSGMAKAGLVTGIIGIVLNGITLGILILALLIASAFK